MSSSGNRFGVWLLKKAAGGLYWLNQLSGGFIAWCLFISLYHVFRYRREVTDQNLNKSFPAKTPEERKQIAKTYYKHLSKLILEVLGTDSLSQKQLRAKCDIVNGELLEQFKQEGRKVFLLTGHFGNWEWAGLILGTLAAQTFNVVYKPLSSPTFEQLMRSIRSRFGNNPLPMQQVVRNLIREQESSITCFLADQTPSGEESHIWLPFLNQETMFFDGVDTLARKLNAAVVLGKMNRVSGNRYQITLELIHGNAGQAAPHEITVSGAKAMEACINKHPDNWLWSHRRWKHQRPEGAPLIDNG